MASSCCCHWSSSVIPENQDPEMWSMQHRLESTIWELAAVSNRDQSSKHSATYIFPEKRMFRTQDLHLRWKPCGDICHSRMKQGAYTEGQYDGGWCRWKYAGPAPCVSMKVWSILPSSIIQVSSSWRASPHEEMTIETILNQECQLEEGLWKTLMAHRHLRRWNQIEHALNHGQGPWATSFRRCMFIWIAVKCVDKYMLRVSISFAARWGRITILKMCTSFEAERLLKGEIPSVSWTLKKRCRTPTVRNMLLSTGTPWRSLQSPFVQAKRILH